MEGGGGEQALERRRQALHGLRRKARVQRVMRPGGICGRSSSTETSNFSQKLQGPLLRSYRRGSDDVPGEGGWATVIREK